MTPTTNERDRFEAWAKDTMSLVKEPGGYKEATTHHAWRAWQAALTREQRVGVCPKCNGAGGERWHEADGSENGQRCEACDGFGTQPEAPGAVAWLTPQQLSDLRQEKPWTAGAFGEFSQRKRDEYTVPLYAATPPAPVDVPVNEVLLYAIEQRDAEIARLEAKLALLDGQQAGVVIDDAMVRRAVHAYDEWMIEHAPDETDAYHDGMRAALTAALGGGGGGG